MPCAARWKASPHRLFKVTDLEAKKPDRSFDNRFDLEVKTKKEVCN